MIAIDINMPKNCKNCEFCIKDEDYNLAFCAASDYIQWHDIKDIPRDSRYQNCPLMEVTKCVDCKFGAADTEAHWFCLDFKKGNNES